MASLSGLSNVSPRTSVVSAFSIDANTNQDKKTEEETKLDINQTGGYEELN